MNTNTTDIQKAAFWWEMELDREKRKRLLLECYGATNVSLDEQDILIMWLKETCAPSPSSTEEMKFTPGPWAIYGSDLIIDPVTGDNICHFSGGLSLNGHHAFVNYESNRNLIAAAPDLYNALKGIIDNWDSNPAGTREELKEYELNGDNYKYYSPSGMIVASEYIAKAREVLAKASKP